MVVKKINKNTWIFFLITITLQILIYTFQTFFSDGDFKSIDEFTRLILIILLLVFGIKIIKLKNDFIGGLKFLGGCFIVYALFFWNLVSEDSRLLFLDVLFIVIIYIFYKAKKNSLSNKKSFEETNPTEIS